MFRRILIRTLVVCLVLAAAMATLAFTSYSRGAEPYIETPAVKSIALPHRFRSWPEHDAIIERTWPKPYIFDHERLVFYGAHHTNKVDDPQFADISARWQSFKPTVALCEGRSRGMFINPLFYRLGGKSEVQHLHELARRDNVRLLSLEPVYQDEVSALLQKWTPEQVALYFTMRVYWGESGGKANEAFAQEMLEKRTNVEGLRGSLKTVADIDRVWKRDFAGEPDWRTLNEEPKRGYLATISDDSRRVRGEHMARTILDLHRKGERVFAVVGSGHVIRTEWILRNALGAPPAADQPPA